MTPWKTLKWAFAEKLIGRDLAQINGSLEKSEAQWLAMQEMHRKIFDRYRAFVELHHAEDEDDPCEACRCLRDIDLLEEGHSQ